MKEINTNVPLEMLQHLFGGKIINDVWILPEQRTQRKLKKYKRTNLLSLRPEWLRNIERMYLKSNINKEDIKNFTVKPLG